MSRIIPSPSTLCRPYFLVFLHSSKFSPESLAVQQLELGHPWYLWFYKMSALFCSELVMTGAGPCSTATCTHFSGDGRQALDLGQKGVTGRTESMSMMSDVLSMWDSLTFISPQPTSQCLLAFSQALLSYFHGPNSRGDKSSFEAQHTKYCLLSLFKTCVVAQASVVFS